MSFYTLLVLIVVVLILPIKLAAHLLGAGRTGIFWCVIAILVSTAFTRFGSVISDMIFGEGAMSGVIPSLPFSALAYVIALRCSFLTGLGVAVVQVLFTAIMFFLIGYLFPGIDFDFELIIG